MTSEIGGPKNYWFIKLKGSIQPLHRYDYSNYPSISQPSMYPPCYPAAHAHLCLNVRGVAGVIEVYGLVRVIEQIE